MIRRLMVDGGVLSYSYVCEHLDYRDVCARCRPAAEEMERQIDVKGLTIHLPKANRTIKDLLEPELGGEA